MMIISIIYWLESHNFSKINKNIFPFYNIGLYSIYNSDSQNLISNLDFLGLCDMYYFYCIFVQ